jgi:hypothetical protein
MMKEKMQDEQNRKAERREVKEGRTEGGRWR